MIGVGHRERGEIRLIIADGSHLRYARNPGTGEKPDTWTGLVPARHSIVHVQGSASRLLPVAP
ncbi:hypothetical protein AB0F17_49390 [Nonomuraea sp. NPDC026600]|uniref:hypothetical protein n=1 Tax=Nonomuraea sp. NPDC026600 TaxID=3155363 RepID=UPI0033FC9A18